MPPLYKSLRFWTLVAGLAAFVAHYYAPTFPLNEAGILALVLFILGLIGVVPEVRLIGLRASLVTTRIVDSLAFWQLVAALAYFVLRYFAPNLPLDETAILAVIVFILSLFGVTPELRSRGLIL